MMTKRQLNNKYNTMGNNSSDNQQQDKINQSPRQKPQQSRLSPKRIILNTNGQKMRQPDPSILKRNSINSSSQNSKPQIYNPKSYISFTEAVNNDDHNSMQHTKVQQKNNSSNSQISINLNQSKKDLYDTHNFINSLWNFMLKQSTNKPQLSIELFTQLILSSIESIKQKFLLKLKKAQIYPIFSQTPQQQTAYIKDLQIFQITLKNRIHKYFSVSKKHPNLLGTDKYQQSVEQTITKLGNTIICELMGKTSIWRSLMLLREEQQQKIMEMLEKQGIDREHFKMITQGQIF